MFDAVDTGDGAPGAIEFHEEDAVFGRAGLFTGDDELAVGEVANGFGEAGDLRERDFGGLPAKAGGVEALVDENGTGLGGGDDKIAAAAVDVFERDEHGFIAERADAMGGPGGGFEPIDTGGGAVAVRDEDIGIAIAVHVGGDHGHNPAGVEERGPAPVFEAFGGGEVAHFGVGAFAAGEEPVADRKSEHPLHEALGGGDGEGGPTASLFPVGVEGAGFALTGGDDVAEGGGGILDIGSGADLFAEPGFADAGAWGVEADDTGFLPAGDELEGIAADDADAVGALRGVVDGVAGPVLGMSEGGEEEQEMDGAVHRPLS